MEPSTRRGRGQGRGRGNKRGIQHRFNPIDMKNRVHPTKCGRKLERTTARLRILVIGYGPMNLGARLRKGYPERQILGGEPYPLTTHIMGSRSLVTIGRCFGPPINPGQGHLSSLPGASTPSEESQGRCDCSLGFLCRK